MKRILLIFLVALIAAPLFSQTIDTRPFRPVTPEVTAQGDSFAAVARGYNSLFTNPAGFAREGGSLTLMSATPMFYVVPTEEEVTALENAGTDLGSAINALSGTIATNGLGAALRVGALGIAGRNLGLGLVSDIDVYGRGGLTALGTQVSMATTIGLVAGYAVPLEFGRTTLNVGGSVKLLQRTEVRDLAVTDLLALAGGTQTTTASIPVLSGVGFGFDAGVLAERGNWAAAFVLRDIGGTSFGYTQANVNPSASDFDPTALFLGGEGGTEVAANYAIPGSMSVGLAWDPQPEGFMRFLFDPQLHAEWRPVFYAQTQNDRSFWSEIHLGLEARMLRFLKFRAGFNQGYATVGLGAKLLFLDVNLAYYTREMGRYAGTRPNDVLALEVALRF